MSVEVFETSNVSENTENPITKRRVFSRFREWVVGVATEYNAPFYGFGGPIETPFANTITAPENVGCPSFNEDLTADEIANAIRTSYDGMVANGSTSGSFREAA
jgi:hypothetical protein